MRHAIFQEGEGSFSRQPCSTHLACPQGQVQSFTAQGYPDGALTHVRP
jgi:hypothetical protein